MSIFDPEDDVKRIAADVVQDAVERIARTLIPAILAQAEGVDVVVSVPEIRIGIKRKSEQGRA